MTRLGVLAILVIGLAASGAWAQAPAAPGQSCEEQRAWLLLFADQQQRSRSQQEVQAAQELARLQTELAKARAALQATQDKGAK